MKMPQGGPCKARTLWPQVCGVYIKMRILTGALIP